MLGGRRRRLAWVTILALVTGGVSALPASASPPPVSFNAPSLFPGFSRSVHDYVVRCKDGPVSVAAHASDVWRVGVDGHALRRGDFSQTVPLRTGREFIVTTKSDSSPQLHRYYVRCLPDDFPKYTFTRTGPASPQFFSADDTFAPVADRYAMIFDNHGVPVWWYHGSAQGPRVLPNGNIIWFRSKGAASRFEIHRPDGSQVRLIDFVGTTPANGHDLQQMANGNYLLGAYVKQDHVDTSAYGGSSDGAVRNAELQEVTPQGQLAWDWKSKNHVALGETGRWWPYVIQNDVPSYGYDIVHWNSIEPDGQSVIASFRALDAVYKINKATGSIAWKLGGTQTPKSLQVHGDPNPETLGGQHDARLLPDGTLTVFDNRSGLSERQPRAVRYRIDQGAGTATLLQSITDPDVSVSWCCGSARRLPNHDWLIDWAQGSNSIGGYRPDGERTFLLTFTSTFSYRAEPVPGGAVSVEDLRQGMNAMCSSGCG